MNDKEKLKQSVKLHKEATELADDAFFARREGDEEAYLKFTKEAYLKESESASMLRHDTSHPMYAILHRSAATLAYRCDEYRAAEQLIAYGLAGDPNERLREELYELLDKVKHSKWLRENNMPVSGDEFILSLQGIEADVGWLEHQSFTKLISMVYYLIRNTLGLVKNHDYQKLPQLNNSYRMLVNTPVKGSFRIGVKLFQSVQPQEQTRLPNVTAYDDVFSRILGNFEELNNGNIEALRENFNNDKYFHNFIGLAKELAPDGERITAVSMETKIEGARKILMFDRTKEEINQINLPPEENTFTEDFNISKETETITGVLQYANAMDDNKEVKLLCDDGSRWIIVVRESFAEHVVKPYFGDRVTIVGRHMFQHRKSRRLYLDDIRGSEEN